ncbi:hypothetical protein Barb7_01931 [Bacteroidales bacterium Barb7]|nr:hypothetical protein Barb7_01931 [Bacteroidales bacterium Barb7]
MASASDFQKFPFLISLSFTSFWAVLETSILLFVVPAPVPANAKSSPNLPKLETTSDPVNVTAPLVPAFLLMIRMPALAISAGAIVKFTLTVKGSKSVTGTVLFAKFGFVIVNIAVAVPALTLSFHSVFSL